MSLFYSKESKQRLLGYANIGYLQIRIKSNHKQGMCLVVIELLFLGDLLSRHGDQIIESFKDYSNSRSKL